MKIKLFFKRTLLLSLSCLLFACQSTSDQVVKAKDVNSIKPLWVEQLPRSASIVYAVGFASRQQREKQQSESEAIQTANASARLALAKIIRVNVKGSSTVNQTKENGRLSFYFNKEVTNSVDDMELSGLTIQENYIDYKNQTVYALAVFDKALAIETLARKINTLDNALQNNYQQELSELTAIIKLRKAIHIKKSLAKRADYNNKRLMFGANEMVMSKMLIVINRQADEILDEVLFAVLAKEVDNSLDSQFNSQLSDKLVSSLSSQGIRVSNQANADFLLIYSISWREREKGGMFYSFANARVSLLKNEPSNALNQETVMALFSQKAKGVSTDKNMSKDKAVEKLAQQFNQVLSKELLKAFE
jgi:hypothetical protein